LKYFSFVLIVYLFLFQFALAQQQERAQTFDTDIQQLEKTNEQIIAQQQYLEQALEKDIDSTVYVLGPGDQLLIKIWGILENQFITEVTPEGYVIVPTIREIKVSGLTLAQGAKVIKKVLSEYFKDSGYSIRLVKLRKFRIFIVGEIKQAGTYYLRGADRVSDAIELAGGLTSWGDDTRVHIRHSDESVDTVNISRFYLKGDLSQNPYLEGGDIIYIPPIDLNKNFVIIEGNVGSEGVYQIRHNESLFDFLMRVRAINRKSNIRAVLLFRKGEKRVFNLLEEESAARSERLQKGDRIIIPSNRNQVYVKGEVSQPGPYPYFANYTIRDYAGFAGILETARGLNSAYVIHSESGKIEKGGNAVVQKGDIVVIPRRRREVFKDYLAILTPIISIGLSVYAIIQTSK